MQALLQQVVSGIAIGGIFASLALALVLIYNAMGLVNFAQGEMAMLATFVAYALINRGMSYWIVFPVTLVLAFAGGILVQRVVIRPVERAPILTLVIITLGLATLVNGLAGFLFGYVPRSFPSPFSAQTVDVLGVFISYRDLRVIAVSGVVLLLIYLLLQRTTVGLTLRAAAHHPEASRLLGVQVSWMLGLGWGLASAVGAVSGIMVAPILFLEPNIMQTIIIYAFAAAVLGGIESPLGAVVGGLLVGVTINLAGAYVPGVGGDLQLAVGLAIIIVVLILKPNGLFGRAARVAGARAHPHGPAPLLAGRARRHLLHRLSHGHLQLPGQRVDPGPRAGDRDHGPQHPGRLQRPAFAWPRRVHGARRVHIGDPRAPLQRRLPAHHPHCGRADRAGRLSLRHPGAAPVRPLPGARHDRPGGRHAEPDQAAGCIDRRRAGHH